MSCDVANAKDEFQRHILMAYDNVDKLLRLEEKVDKIKMMPDKVDEAKNLRLEHISLQRTIDEQIKNGLMKRNVIIDEYKRRKNNTCGHIGKTPNVECAKCSETKLSAELFSSKEPKKWISSITPKNEFTILIFYRGTWCGNCAIYLREVDHCLVQLRQLGAEVYAICSQSQVYVDEMKEDTKVGFELISDPKNALGKKFDIKITNKNGNSFKVMSRIIKSALGGTDNYDPHHEDGIVQPAVVILKDEEVMYKWVTPASINVGYGMFERMTPSSIVDIIRFHSVNEVSSNICKTLNMRKQSIE
ncbi:peroxiredoxin [Acrasis kona]|uniref:Peroxiredoxin n=1 Tax=Acrasis kona TaxID=1008807 RepID=A0AAW2YT96_9EUKA